MIETSKKILLLVGLFKSSESFPDLEVLDAIAPEEKCILQNTWTEWVEQGTCGEVTRTRSYKYYMCEYEIS